MALRKRQKQRLLIIAGVLVLGAVAAFTAHQWRQRARDDEAREQRDRAVAALEAGKYQAALVGIGKFLRRLGATEATAEDYYTLGVARGEVPAPNNKHLAASIAAFQRSLELDPTRRETQQALLDKYVLVGFRTEARDLIDTMLERTPDDVELLTLRCDLLDSLGELDAALRQAEAINQTAPDNLPGFLRTAQIRIRLEQPYGEIESWVDEVAARHADDLRFELLRAFVYVQLAQRRRGDPTLLERAGESLDRVLASQRAVEDPVAVQILVGVLDGLSRFDDAIDALINASAGADDRVRVELLRRLWYRRRAAEIPGIVAGWEQEGHAIPAEAQALRALSVGATGQTDEAAAMAASMAAGDDPQEKAWGELIGFVPLTDEKDRLAAMEAARAVEQLAPDSAIVHHLMGQFSAGADIEIAREHWTAAGQRAPSWGEPLRRIAASLIGTERQHEAPRLAILALKRSAGDPEAAATLADAWVANAGRLSTAGVEQLRRQLVEWKEQAAGPLAAHLGTLEIALDSQTDPAAARGRLEGALASAPDASEATLLRLAQLASRTQSDLADRFLDASEEVHGTTPRLAFVRALIHARRTTPEAGLRLFGEARARAADPELTDWRMARAALLERLSMPEAGPEWVALADAHPDSLSSQLGCLGSARAWQDREAIGRVIDRVRGLAGEESATWRIARGRWLLRDPEPTEESLSRAVGLLNEATKLAPASIDAHVNLARALERVGNSLDRVEEELRRASELSPRNVGLQLELARVSARRGRTAEARRLVGEVLGSGELTTEQVVDAAVLLAAQGDYRRGTDVLLSRVSVDEAPREGLIVLATLYQRLGEYERALEICDRLMDRPELDVLELAAGLHAALGRERDAALMLARMDAVTAEPAERARAKARFSSRWGTEEQARDAHWQAVAAAPDDEAAWIALLEVVVAQGNDEALDTVLADSRARGIEAVRFVRENEGAIRAALPTPGLRNVVVEALREPDARDALLRTLATLEVESGELPPVGELAPKVRELARENPDLLSLQLIAAELVARAGEIPAAIDIARRAAERNPRSVLPARQTAQLLARDERWEEAVDAGLDWRERGAPGDLDVEAFIGIAMTHAGRIGDALIQFEANLETAVGDPDAGAAYLATYAAALVRSGQTEQAGALLEPLTGAHAALRQRLISMSVRDLGSAEKCVAWLDLLERVVPTDEPGTATALATKWAAAFEIFGGESLRERAAASVARLTERPDASADDHFMAGVLAGQAGDAATAEKAYRRALEIDAEQFAARNNLAILLADSGRADEAVAEARRVVEQLPRNPDVLDTLGYTLLKAGELEEARQRFEEALSHAPKRTSFMLNLAETLHAMGASQECQATVVRIVELEQDEPQLDPDARDRLEALREALR